MPKRNRNSRRRRSGKSRGRGPSSRGGLVRCNADMTSRIPVPRYIPTNTPVVFQLRNLLTLSSDGAGNIKSYIAFDPSATTQTAFGTVTQFPEWTDIAALYQRCKLLQFDICMVPELIDDLKGDALAPLGICSVAAGTPTAPTTMATVIDNGDSIIWNPLRDYSGVAKTFSRKIPGLGWAASASPGGTVIAGAPGGFLFFGAFGGFVSIPICAVKVVGTYLVDTRI